MSARTTAAACGALTTATLPVFLVGALSDELRTELGIDETAIGAAVTLLFLVAAFTAPMAGRFAERFGAVVALRGGVSVAGLLALAVGLLARGWWQLALPMAGIGVAVALVDTGAARAFADRIAPDRLGSAFGLKEASVPAASLLAGLAIPTLAAQVGWRSTFVATLAVAAVVLVVIPRGPSHAAGSRPDADLPLGVGDVSMEAAPRVPLAIMAFAAAIGLGAGAATAVATFLVPAMTDRGFGVTAAGLTLSIASIASIVARIVLGRWADRPASSPAGAITVLCLLGAAAATALATPAPAVLAGVAAVLLLGAGWGWTGLAFLTAVRAHPRAPAAAAGVVLSGLGAGGALGPLAFGALAGRASYTVAWVAVAGAFLVTGATSATLQQRLAVPATR